MKNGVQKFSSLVLALLVLVSTFSFTIEKHFCGDLLVDQAVFSKVKDCGMSYDTNHRMDVENISDTCCNNTHLSIDGQDELKISFQNLNLDQQVFVAAFTFSFIELFEGSPLQVTPYKNYTPPLIVKDIPVLNDTFLI